MFVKTEERTTTAKPSWHLIVTDSAANLLDDVLNKTGRLAH